jgi:hypothetical protein
MWMRHVLLVLRRALGDLTVRVVQGIDRPGVITWGFDRLVRVDDTLDLFSGVPDQASGATERRSAAG